MSGKGYQDIYCCVCGGPFDNDDPDIVSGTTLPEGYVMPDWIYQSSGIKFMGHPDYDRDECDTLGSTANGYVNLCL